MISENMPKRNVFWIFWFGFKILGPFNNQISSWKKYKNRAPRKISLPLKFALEVVKARFLEIIFFNISLKFFTFFIKIQFLKLAVCFLVLAKRVWIEGVSQLHTFHHRTICRRENSGWLYSIDFMDRMFNRKWYCTDRGTAISIQNSIKRVFNPLSES